MSKKTNANFCTRNHSSDGSPVFIAIDYTVTNHDTLHAKRSITNQKNKKELV